MGSILIVEAHIDTFNVIVQQWVAEILQWSPHTQSLFNVLWASRSKASTPTDYDNSQTKVNTTSRVCWPSYITTQQTTRNTSRHGSQALRVSSHANDPSSFQSTHLQTFQDQPSTKRPPRPSSLQSSATHSAHHGALIGSRSSSQCPRT